MKCSWFSSIGALLLQWFRTWSLSLACSQSDGRWSTWVRKETLTWALHRQKLSFTTEDQKPDATKYQISRYCEILLRPTQISEITTMFSVWNVKLVMFVSFKSKFQVRVNWHFGCASLQDFTVIGLINTALLPHCSEIHLINQVLNSNWYVSPTRVFLSAMCSAPFSVWVPFLQLLQHEIRYGSSGKHWNNDILFRFWNYCPVHSRFLICEHSHWFSLDISTHL